MNQKQLRTTLAPPTPELPVEDVERAQQHYRDVFGFEGSPPRAAFARWGGRLAGYIQEAISARLAR